MYPHICMCAQVTVWLCVIGSAPQTPLLGRHCHLSVCSDITPLIYAIKLESCSGTRLAGVGQTLSHRPGGQAETCFNSLTKLCAVGVGTTSHLLPMTTPVGCTQLRHHHLMSSRALETQEYRTLFLNSDVYFPCIVLISAQSNGSNSPLRGKQRGLWHPKHFRSAFEMKHHLKLWVNCCGLHGGTCLSWAVARSCHSSFCPTVVARKATPF